MSFDYLDYLSEERIGYYVSTMEECPCIVLSVGDAGDNTDIDKFVLPLRVDVPSEVALCLRLLRKLMNANDMFYIVYIRGADIFVMLDKDDISIGFVHLIDSISYQVRDNELYDVTYNENDNGQYNINLN